MAEPSRARRRTTDLLRYLDSTRAELRAAVETVDEAARALRPREDRWSVAEVLEHVAIVERRITHLVRTRMAEASALRAGADDGYSGLGESVEMKRATDRSFRIVTSAASAPTGALDAPAAWAAAEEARAAFRDVVRATDGLALDSVTAPHPALGPFDLLQWIVFVGAHEKRHAEQIREIRLESGQEAAS